MTSRRGTHSLDFRVRVAFEALKGLPAIHLIASKYEVYPAFIERKNDRFKVGPLMAEAIILTSSKSPMRD